MTSLPKDTSEHIEKLQNKALGLFTTLKVGLALPSLDKMLTFNR